MTLARNETALSLAGFFGGVRRDARVALAVGEQRQGADELPLARGRVGAVRTTPDFPPGSGPKTPVLNVPWYALPAW
ncbi:hypothetical protein ACH4U5_11125 [Streptomyces sp. NPDC020858]|uniref:hypothetical protein n=1 Tax=Streptomyces sp. NPDC020858 TaxID=3365097 RepID=UPI0037BC2D84